MTNSTSAGDVGYLRLKVTSASGTVPVPDATVYIYTDPDDESEGRLLFTLVTDVDGLTEAVTLPTPPLSESFSPTYPKPYSTYNIFVTKDGFYPAEGRTVPLFPGITSIQPVNLVPLSEGMGGDIRE